MNTLPGPTSLGEAARIEWIHACRVLTIVTSMAHIRAKEMFIECGRGGRTPKIMVAGDTHLKTSLGNYFKCIENL